MERLFRFTDKEGYQVENNGCSPYGGEYAQGGDVAQSYYGKPQVAKPVAALHLICYFRCAGIMQKVEETFIKEYAYEQAGYAQNRSPSPCKRVDDNCTQQGIRG